VVRESLAERVPVVSARVGDTGPVASEPRLGALVRPGDVTAFRHELAAILDSPDRRAPIDDSVLEPLRERADEPYRLMRELYREAS
jgi:glycosyltransferase involved in cell wall biosynthesis